jgi:hypothetical protein
MSNFKLTNAFANIQENIKEIEKIGIKCSKRNGKAEDPEQKKAIDLATKIGVRLVQKGYFNEAYNVAIPLCNMTMGPRKAAAATTIATQLIENKQVKLATQMALFIAPLKGTLKIKTAIKIALTLKENKYNDQFKLIFETVKNNPVEYAQIAVRDIKNQKLKQRGTFNELFSNIKENFNELERIGIKCSKSNKKVEESAQIKAIGLAAKIGLSLIKSGYYESAFNVAYPLCNATMGSLKSPAAIKIASGLIKYNQDKFALKIAMLVAPLKGESKINVAKEIAFQFRDKGLTEHVKAIYLALKQNPLEYAQSAAVEIKRNKKGASLTINDLLSNIKENLNEIERIGIKCSKSNKKVEDPTQIKAIGLTTKIGLALVEHGYYENAFNVVYPLCNVTMGSLKSPAAIKIARELIKHNQDIFALKLALLVAPLKGESKTNVAKAIAIDLRNKGQFEYVKDICEELKKNSADYVKNALLDLEHKTTELINVHSKFINTFEVKTQQNLDVSKNVSEDIKFFQKIKTVFSQKLAGYETITCQTNAECSPEIRVVLGKKKCVLEMKKKLQKTDFEWNFDGNTIFKNHQRLSVENYTELTKAFKLFLESMKAKKVDYYAEVT